MWFPVIFSRKFWANQIWRLAYSNISPLLYSCPHVHKHVHILWISEVVILNCCSWNLGGSYREHTTFRSLVVAVGLECKLTDRLATVTFHNTIFSLTDTSRLSSSFFVCGSSVDYLRVISGFKLWVIFHPQPSSSSKAQTSQKTSELYWHVQK